MENSVINAKCCQNLTLSPKVAVTAVWAACGYKSLRAWRHRVFHRENYKTINKNRKWTPQSLSKIYLLPRAGMFSSHAFGNLLQSYLINFQLHFSTIREIFKHWQVVKCILILFFKKHLNFYNGFMQMSGGIMWVVIKLLQNRDHFSVH